MVVVHVNGLVVVKANCSISFWPNHKFEIKHDLRSQLLVVVVRVNGLLVVSKLQLFLIGLYANHKFEIKRDLWSQFATCVIMGKQCNSIADFMNQ